jgi:uncharacterized membrane protein YhaH (DUF805 family)
MRKYYSFQGTVRRQEYWGTSLLGGLIHIVAMLVMVGLGAILTVNELGMILLIPLIISNIWIHAAVAAKRCRDIGINPWWAVCNFMPYIGFVTFIVFGCLKSKTSE